MKILLDANISWKIAKNLDPIFGKCEHVDFIKINIPANDLEIWNYAKENEYIIITKDNDFIDLLEKNGFPPKVVLLKTGNNRSSDLEALLIKAINMIKDLETGNFGLLEIVK